MTVTKTGTGTVPAPVVVDALTIGQMADADRRARCSAPRGRSTKASSSRSTASARSARRSRSANDRAPPTLYSFSITGVAKVEGSLADITMSGIEPQHVHGRHGRRRLLLRLPRCCRARPSTSTPAARAARPPRRSCA